MSLLVNTYTRNAADEIDILEPEDDSQELAGFESYRKTFYGCQAALSLGLQLLPSLANGDLYCEGNDLERLRYEANVVLQNIKLFTEDAVPHSESSLQFRIHNILTAINRAQAVHGGVVMW